MFSSKEFTAIGTGSIKNNGAPGRRLSLEGKIEQKFMLFSAESTGEMIEGLEGLGIEARRKNFINQMQYNLVTACKISEDESKNSALGIFVNLGQFQGELPSLEFLKVVGEAIMSEFRKMKYIGDSTLRDSLVLSLVSHAYEECYGCLMAYDAMVSRKERV